MPPQSVLHLDQLQPGMRKMTCFSNIPVQKDFPEGATSYHDFSFLDKNDDPITNAESIRYKLSDGVNIVFDWVDFAPAVAPGEIEIEAVNNITSDCLVLRYLTIEATHNGGKKITQTIAYRLINSPNIVP